MGHITPYFVGLDVGTSEIKAVAAPAFFRESDGLPEISAGARRISKGLRKSAVIHIESASEVIRAVLDELEELIRQPIKSVYCSVGGAHLQSQNCQGVVPIKNHEVSPYDIQQVLESARSLIIPVEREVLHVLPREFIVDEQDGVKDPRGMAGGRLEARVHVVTGLISASRNLVKAVNTAGRAVKGLVYSGLASGHAVLLEEENDLGALVIDLGGGTTTLTAFRGAVPFFSRVVPVGGNHVTNDIAAGLRTPIVAAEDLKCRSGAASASSLNGDQELEVPSVGRRPSRTVSSSVVADLIEPRVAELFSLIRHELHRSELASELHGGVILTGGGAKLRGIAEVAETTLKLPVRIGGPVTGRGGNMPQGDDPSSATVVGIPSEIRLRREELTKARAGGQFGDIWAKAQSWLARHF